MNQAERRPIGWLVAGALAGLALAAWGLLETPEKPGDPVGNDWAARIDDSAIPKDRLDDAVARVEAATGQVATDAVRDEILERLIAEELLFRRGVELGIVNADDTVRSAVVQSLIASVTAAADAANPDDNELAEFLTANSERYTYASAMTVDAWTSESEADARRFARGLGGEPTDGPGLTRVPGLPDGPMPAERLRMFVGPAIASAALDMTEGEAAVFARQGRWYVLRVRSRDESALADLDSVRSQLLIDYRQQLAEEQLADYVQELERRADIVRATP